MKSFLKRFDWSRFLQFSLPYAVGMKIFGPEWSWMMAISTAIFFGTFMTIFMGRELEEEEKNTLPYPDVLKVSYKPEAKFAYFALFGTGSIATAILGTLAMFVFQIAPETPQTFPTDFYCLFFYGLSFGLYISTRSIQYHITIDEEKIIKHQKNFWGFQENIIYLEDIREVKANVWGNISILLKDNSEFTIPIPMGNDYSNYQYMGIEENEIINPNFPGAYQIEKDLMNRIQRNKIEELAA